MSASPRRARQAAAALCAAGAIGLVSLVMTNGNDVAVLATTDASLDSAQLAEFAPRSTVASTTLSPSTTVPDAVTSTTLGLSPLAAQLGASYSVIPTPVVDLPVPVEIRIESIGVDADPVIPVGLTDSGDLDVPGAAEVGWYKLGQTPDQPGATVLAAHVNWQGDLGVFSQLGNLEPGSEIYVTLSDGTRRKYVAWERTMFDKTELPYDRIWTREGNEVLVLITCGGEFNPDIRRYKQNIVVFAVPVPLAA